MLTCKEASILISERQDRKLRLYQRLALRMHLWVCGNCRRFERQMRLIRRMLRSGREPETTSDQLPGLSAEARERIRTLLAERDKPGE